MLTGKPSLPETATLDVSKSWNHSHPLGVIRFQSAIAILHRVGPRLNLDRLRAILKVFPGVFMPVVELVGVTKAYDTKIAVSDLSLSIEAGQMFGLLGPNGAG